MSAKKKTLAGAHKAAIIFVGALILILAVTLGFVRYWWTTIDTFNDTDGTLYNVRRNGDAYALYDAKGNLLPTTIEDEKLCYVTELGTIVMLDNRGTASIYAVVDTGEGEEVSAYNNLMIYKKIENANVKSIKIILRGEDKNHSYIFERNSNGQMVLKGHENVIYNEEAYAYLASICGSTTTMHKVSAEALAKFGYEEYGLDNPQATMTITAKNGVSHSLDIGKQIVSGNGYYVRLQGRDAVYIMNSYVGKYILQPVETYVTPYLHFGMTEQNYMFVYNFKMTRFTYDEAGTPTGKLLTALSYWDYAERENTEFQTQAYYITDESLDGYAPSSDAVYKSMGGFLECEYVGVKKLGADQESRIKYGLDKPEYSLYYECDRTENGVKYYVKNYLYFSHLTENGTRYAIADVYVSDKKDGDFRKLDSTDFIVEMDRAYLDFLNWDTLDWIERDYFQINIGIMDYLEFDMPDGQTIRFEVQQIDKDNVKVYAVKDGKRVPIDTNNFKTLYLNLLGGKLFGSAELTKEKEAEITSAPDRFRLTWRFKTTTGLERTHSYYFLETNKDYITINGDGGFYVISSTVQKAAEDALKVYNGQRITADSPFTSIDEK